jgi:hypothetical protein
MIGVDLCVWKPPGVLSEDFLNVVDLEFFIAFTKCFTKQRLIICYHFMYINVTHDDA